MPRTRRTPKLRLQRQPKRKIKPSRRAGPGNGRSCSPAQISSGKFVVTARLPMPQILSRSLIARQSRGAGSRICGRCLRDKVLSVKREIGSRLFFHRIADLGPLNFVTRILTLVLGILLGHALSGFAQETVTIPKSRLEELERKEAELETLKSSA